MAAGYLLGMDCKLFRNTSTYGSPTWNEVTLATDVNCNQSAGKGDVSSRVSAFKLYRAAQIDATIEFTMRYDSGNDDYTAFKTAFLARSILDVWVADGAAATTGTTGPRMNVMITEFSHEQPLTDGANIKVSMCPAVDATATQTPVYFTIP